VPVGKDALSFACQKGKQSPVNRLTHLDARGEASMVDVSSKPVMLREAVARGEICLAKSTLRLIKSNQIAKGNVLATARLAGILAAKRTGELIPLCHPLPSHTAKFNLKHQSPATASSSPPPPRSPHKPASRWKHSPP